MLIEFRVKNFRSIKDEQVLSMVATKDDSHPENVVEIGGLRLLRSACIWGANASGKSSVWQAFGQISQIVEKSAVTPRGTLLPYEPFHFDRASRERPTRLEILFLLGGTKYQFGFEYSLDTIHKEWLIAYPKNRAQLWYERKTRSNDGEVSCNFGPSFKGEKAKLKSTTRQESLLLSNAAQQNHPLLSPIYDWIKRAMRPVSPTGPKEPITGLTLLRARKLNTPASRLYEKIVLDALRRADIGISDISVKERDVEMPADVKTAVAEMDRESREYFESLKKTATLEILFKYNIAGTDEPFYLPISSESDGTQRFFALLGPLVDTLMFGYVPFIDEIERSMHPWLSHKLVEMFHQSIHPDHPAQLLMTSHDATLLDLTLFRRDQVFFTEKDDNGCTHLYSLSDYKKPPRKDEAIMRGYLAGRYGAVPDIESLLDPEVLKSEA